MKTLLATILTFLLLTTSALAITFKGAGRVVNYSGKASITHNGSSKSPTKGMDLYVGDTIVTKAGKMSFIMADESIMSLGPESNFTIKEFTMGKDNKRNGAFNLAFGKVRSAVTKSLAPGSQFTVRTPTAVAGVRGTEFFTSFDRSTGKTDIAVLEGVVSVKSSLDRQDGEVKVGANQRTTIDTGKPPAIPTFVPKTELQEMKKTYDISPSESTKENGKTETRKSDDSGGSKNGTADSTTPAISKESAVVATERVSEVSVKAEKVKDLGEQQKSTTGVIIRWK